MATRPKTHMLLLNSGRAGVVYTTAGAQLGGGERITVTGLDAVGQAAVDRGYLSLVEVPSNDN